VKNLQKNENLATNAYGSVRPYSRHRAECPHAADAEYNTCSCPKWLYVWNRKTGNKSRKSLVTPSWAEAQRIAAETLRGMDPDIAAAKTANEKTNKQRMTVSDACDLWIERTKRQCGEKASVLEQYRTITKKLKAWAEAHGIVYVQDVSPLQLERWYSSAQWKAYSETTRAQRWGIVRSIFSFLAERGVVDKSPAAGIRPVKENADHVQGPYSATQVKKLLNGIELSADRRLSEEERKVYVPRLRAFVNLLLSTGCDIGDGVLFEPSRIETHKINGRSISVYRYKRGKTGVLAVIPLPDAVADELRKVPLLTDTPASMPFRTVGTGLKANHDTWSRRIQTVLKAQGIKWVELPSRDANGQFRRKKANAKQLRHTFAVGQLEAGQRPEEVARMLGHTNTTMLQRHYAPWVKAIDEAHITRVVSSWK
jgi:site-specific recombinase XerD